MMGKPKHGRSLGDNPLEGEQLLLDALYGSRVRTAVVEPETAGGSTAAKAPALGQRAPKRTKPEHYKVVSISLYTEDIERLEHLVGELKKRGHHKANKSHLIRQALEQVDLDQVSKG